MENNQEQIERAAGRLDLWKLFETIPHSVVAFDSRLTVMAANAKFRAMLAGSGIDMKPDGQTMARLFPGSDGVLEDVCRTLVARGKPEFLVHSIRMEDGQKIECRLVSVEPGQDDLRLLLMIPPPRSTGVSPHNSASVDYHKLAESVVDILFTTDDQGRIIYISPQVEHYGYNPREVIYHPLFEYIHPDDLEITQKLFFSIVKDNDGGPYQFRMMLKDGSFEWMEVRARAHFDGQGKLKSVDGVLRNIAERIELETERARASRLESLELLAGGIAHDFNNLLTSILGGISLARSLEDKTGKASEILGKAENAVVRAGELTQQLLTFARGSKPVRELTDPGGLIEESVSLNLLGSNVRSNIELEPGLWPVNVDKGQLVQVFSNLVINAKQAMSGGGSIEVRAENVVLEFGEIEPLDPGRYVVISVEDTGEGISPENLNKVFDPYFTTKAQGTGLGLATVFSILRRHGGVVTVDSQPGKGSDFRVYLPAAEGRVEHHEQKPSRQGRKHGKVLVMDDEEEVRSICGKILERAGHRVVTCAEGETALKLYCEAVECGEPFDLVILDLTVPGGMGGLDTIRLLKEYDPAVRALVSSGYSNDPVMAEPARYGFSAVVPKPYNFEQMKSTVAGLLSS